MWGRHPQDAVQRVSKSWVGKWRYTDHDTGPLAQGTLSFGPEGWSKVRVRVRQ